jgi:hypothetical protein
MKVQKNLFGIALASLSLFLTGCYSQLQSLDYSSPTNRGIHKDYYSWGSSANDITSEEIEAPATAKASNSIKETEEDFVSEEELDETGIYYKDYEAAEWYSDNYADKIYWDGYDDGFNDGYEEGIEDASYHYWDAHFYSLRTLHKRGYSRFGFNYSWKGHLAFSYYPYYYNDPFWYGFNSSYYYWSGFRYPTWGFYDPFFYGGWGYYGRPYRNYVVVYNDYHRVTRSRSGRHYDGPRSTGLASRNNGSQNAGVTRTRSSDSITSKNTGRTGNTAINTGRTRTNSGSDSRYTGRTRTSSSTGNSAVRTNRSGRTQSSGVTNNTRTNRTRSSGVTNRNRSNNNSSNVRSNSSSRTRNSSGVRSTNRSGSNNRSTVRSNNTRSNNSRSTVRSNSSRSNGRSTVRSNSGSSRSRSSGTRSSSSRSRSRSGGN